jgi:hypothetical protein
MIVYFDYIYSIERSYTVISSKYLGIEMNTLELKWARPSRTVTPKEKQTTMPHEEWDDKKRRCTLTAEHTRRRLASEENKAATAAEVCLSLGGAPSEAGSGCYPLTGRIMAGDQRRIIEERLYFAEPPSLSQIRLSRMERCVNTT